MINNKRLSRGHYSFQRDWKPFMQQPDTPREPHPLVAALILGTSITVFGSGMFLLDAIINTPIPTAVYQNKPGFLRGLENKWQTTNQIPRLTPSRGRHPTASDSSPVTVLNTTDTRVFYSYSRQTDE